MKGNIESWVGMGLLDWGWLVVVGWDDWRRCLLRIERLTNMLVKTI